MKPLSPIALILWHYQQGSLLTTEERQELFKWTEDSEERKILLHDLVNQKKWIKQTLSDFLNEFDQSIMLIKSKLDIFHPPIADQD